MKKLIISLFTLVLICNYTNAQNYNFVKGQVDLNVGLGVGGTLLGSVAKSKFLPISASLDIGINDQISIGGYFGYAGATLESFIPGNSGTDFSNLIFGARVGYHFAMIDGIDTYAGGLLGYNQAKIAGEFPIDLGTGGFVWSGYFGGTYILSDSFGVFAEVGYGISVLRFGANLSF